MDDSLEDEIIYEMICAHGHLLWKYVSVTSASISDMALPTSCSRLLRFGPLVVITLLVITGSYLLQYNGWLQELLLGYQRTIKQKVNQKSLKDFVSTSSYISSSDSFSQELQEGVVGVYAMQGRRATMEDRFCAQQDVSVAEDRTISFFGVFDGHGGQYVAEYVKQNLFTNTIDKIKELQLNKNKNGLHNGCPKNSSCSSNVNSNRRKSSGSVNIPSKSTTTSTDRRHSFDETFLSNLGSIEENPTDNNSDEPSVNGATKSSSSSSSNKETPKPTTSEKVSSSVNSISPQSSAKEPSATTEDTVTDDSQPLKQKEDPYSSVSSKKRNSISVGVTTADASSCHSAARDQDGSQDLYVDSHNNINYTRLLTDQLAHIDNKVVDWCKSKGDLSGTTAVVAIMDGDLLIIGNVGDSRAVMADVKGSTIPLSFDHKPNQLKERRRIKEAGGFITFTGVWRVAGVLATSRAVGDFPLKDPRKLITAEPDVLTFSIKDHKADFIILATDGLWDVLTNEEAVEFVRNHISEKDYGAKSLSIHAYNRGSQDNITVVIINIGKK